MKDKAAVSTRRCQPTAGVGHFLEESCPHRDWTEEAGEEEEDKVGGGQEYWRDRQQGCDWEKSIRKEDQRGEIGLDISNGLGRG